MATINDVAKEANVSIASVSRYLNGKGSVSQEKADSIKLAVEKLDYKVDSAAQSLKTGKSYRIGLVSPATGPHYWEIISSLENTLAHLNYFSNIIFTREPKYNKDKKDVFSKIRDVDGTVIMPLDNKIDYQVIKVMTKQKAPFVIVDRLYDNKNYYQVGTDNIDIGKSAAEIFLAAGHREFLFLKGSEDVACSAERFAGFKEGLQNFSIDLPDARCIEGDFNPQKIFACVSKDIDKLPPFTAVFSSNDLMALAFIQAAQLKGIKAPDDYSIIGVDDLDFLPYIQPGLCTFRQPLQTMGTIAANMLVSQVEEYAIREKRVILKAQYIQRESVKQI